MPSTRSDQSEGTLFSSATYINNDDGHKSVQSKKMLPVINTDKLGMKIRVIKGLIDLRFMIRRWFFNLCLYIGVLILLLICLNLILFYFLYTKPCRCDVGIIESNDDGKETTYIIPNVNEEKDDDEQPTKEAKKHNWFFWTTQIFEKIESAGKDIKSTLASVIGTVSRSLEKKISEIVIEQEERTRGFWMELTNTERFRFETLKSKNDRGSNTRKRKKPETPKSPPVWPRGPPPQPRPTSVWIGPPGAPGEQHSGLHFYVSKDKLISNLLALYSHRNNNTRYNQAKSRIKDQNKERGYLPDERNKYCFNNGIIASIRTKNYCPLV